jgi:hypothetical protein
LLFLVVEVVDGDLWKEIRRVRVIDLPESSIGFAT